MKKEKIFLIMLSIILPLVTVTVFALSPTFNGSPKTLATFDIKSLKVLYVSSNSTMPEIVDKLQLLGVTQRSHSDLQEYLPTDTSNLIGLNESTLVVLDADWISNQTGNLKISTFLREAFDKGAKLTAIGGLTSKFFEALDGAGVCKLGRDETGNVRNPAHSNPPLVGFMLKQASAPDGSQYSYPSILTSNTSDVDTRVQALINWLGG